MCSSAPLFVWWLNTSSCPISQKTRTQSFVYCMCVLDNKHGSVEPSRLVRLREERGQRDNDRSVSATSYVTSHPVALHVTGANRKTRAHTRRSLYCRSRYGATLPVQTDGDKSDSVPRLKRSRAESLALFLRWRQHERDKQRGSDSSWMSVRPK